MQERMKINEIKYKKYREINSKTIFEKSVSDNLSRMIRNI